MLIVSAFHHWQVLYLQAAVLLWVTTSLVKNLFFGTLRAAEVEVDSTSALSEHSCVCTVL